MPILAGNKANFNLAPIADCAKPTNTNCLPGLPGLMDPPSESLQPRSARGFRCFCIILPIPRCRTVYLGTLLMMTLPIGSDSVQSALRPPLCCAARESFRNWFFVCGTESGAALGTSFTLD